MNNHRLTGIVYVAIFFVLTIPLSGCKTLKPPVIDANCEGIDPNANALAWGQYHSCVKNRKAREARERQAEVDRIRDENLLRELKYCRRYQDLYDACLKQSGNNFNKCKGLVEGISGYTGRDTTGKPVYGGTDCTGRVAFHKRRITKLSPVTSFVNGVTFFENVTDGGGAFFSREGKLLAKTDKNRVIRLTGDRAIFQHVVEGRVSNLKGYMSTGGQYIGGSFTKAGDFHDGLALVDTRKNAYTPSSIGFIDKSGKFVFGPKQRTDAKPFSEGMAVVGDLDKRKYGYIDKSGKFAIPQKFDYADSFSDGLASVKLGGKYGYINKSGNLVIPARYDLAYGFSEGLAVVKVAKKYFYIDKKGNRVFGRDFEDALAFSEGLAGVRVGKTSAIINKQGKLVASLDEQLRFPYTKPFAFSEGRAMIRKGNNDKFGFIDRSGKLVVPPIYDDAENYSEGVALVKEGYVKTKFIDLNGKEALTDFEWKD